jgi:capsular exopolysaccharide synthesis family protein
MEPLDHLRTLRRRWPLVVGAPLLAVVVALVVIGATGTTPSEPVASSFRAEHTLFADTTTGATLPAPLGTMAFLATKGEIPVRVSERLGGTEEGPVLAAQMSVTANTDLGTIIVATSQQDPQRAVELVDAFAAELVAFFSERAETQRLSAIDTTARLLEQQQAEIRALDTELSGLPEESSARELVRAERDAFVRQYGGTVERFQQLNASDPQNVGLVTLESGVAVPQEEGGFQAPTSAGPRLLIALLMGSLIGIALAFVVDKVDTRVRTRRGAESAFGLPVVAEVPRLSRKQQGLVTITHPTSLAAEAYRALRLSLQLMTKWVLPSDGAVDGDAARIAAAKDDVRTVLVTSASAGDGKTTTAGNLAAGFAEAGKQVLILDCDFRRPSLHTLFGLERSEGVADYLAQGPAATRSLISYAQRTEVRGVAVITSGSSAVGIQSLGPDTALVQEASRIADVVILDAGPLLAVNDAVSLAAQADAVVVVARAGRTTGDAAQRMSELLARVGARVLGVALVGVRGSEFGNRYHYYAPTRSNVGAHSAKVEAGEPSS